jgi:transcriptional regulator with XRE-family HTH domain
MGACALDNPEMDIHAIIAKNLDDWINNHPRLNTDQAVAEASGVGRTTIQRYRKREGNPTIQNLADIARAFRRKPEELLLQPEYSNSKNVAQFVAEPEPAQYTNLALELARLADEMNDDGKWELIGTAKVLARLHPKAKANRK